MTCNKWFMEETTMWDGADPTDESTKNLMDGTWNEPLSIPETQHCTEAISNYACEPSDTFFLKREAHKQTTTTSPSGKQDSGKPRMSLVPPIALAEVAKVMTFGAQKYGPHNWEYGMEWSRLLDAALRHLNAFNRNEDLDLESGLSHLAHAACEVLMLLEYTQKRRGLDDRTNEPVEYI